MKKTLKAFESYLKIKRLSPASIKNYLSDAKKFLSWLEKQGLEKGKALTDQISAASFEKYKAYLNQTKTPAKTINRYFSSLRGFGEFLKREKLMMVNPTHKLENIPKKQVIKENPVLDTQQKISQLSQAHKKTLIIASIILVLVVLGLIFGIYAYNRSQKLKEGEAFLQEEISLPSRKKTSQETTSSDEEEGEETSDSDLDLDEETEIDIEEDEYACLLDGTCEADAATCDYCLNARALQGHTPSASASASKVPVITDSGDLVLADDSPQLLSTSGTFGVGGQALTLFTDTGTDGDITLAPDGTGAIYAHLSGDISDHFRITNANISSGALLSAYAGNSLIGYDLLRLSSGASEIDRFTISTQGDMFLSRNATISGSLQASSATIRGWLTDLFKIQNNAGTDLFKVQNDGKVAIDQYLTHLGDTDTFLNFEDDSLQIDVGAAKFLHFSEGSDPDLLQGNYNNENIDFQWDGDTNDAVFFVDAASEQVGIGTNNPGYKFQVVGNAYVEAETFIGGILTMGNDILPNTDDSHDLGSSTSEWHDLYVDGTAFVDALSLGGNITMPDDSWIGLGAAAGRLEFDNQATDELNILDAWVGIGTSTPGGRLEIDTTTSDVFALLINHDDPDISAVDIDIVNTEADVVNLDWNAATTGTGDLIAYDIDLTNLTPFDNVANYTYGVHINDPAANNNSTSYGLYVEGINWDFSIYTDDDIATLNNLWVGATTHTLSNAGFALDGDDAFVAGMMGIEGRVYTDTGFTVGPSTSYDDGTITKSTGSSLSVVLGGAAGDDFIVNTNSLVVESDTNNVGIGTTDTQPFSGLYHGQLTIQGQDSTNAILARSTPNTSDASAAIFHQAHSSANWSAVRVQTVTSTGSSAVFDVLTGVNDTTGVGGTLRFGVYQDGDVGIGENSPGAKLEIAQTDAANDEALLIDTEETTAGQDVFKIISDVGGDETTVFNIDANGDITTASGLTGSWLVDNTTIGTEPDTLYHDTYPVVIGDATALTDNTPLTNVNFILNQADGNDLYVEDLLGVADTIYTENNVVVGNTLTLADGSITQSTGSSLSVALGGAAGDDFIVDTDVLVVESDDDQVGIGTTNPGTKLHLYDTDSVEHKIEVNTSNNEKTAGLRLKVSGTGQSRTHLILDGGHSAAGSDDSTSNDGNNIIFFNEDGTTKWRLLQKSAGDTLSLFNDVLDRRTLKINEADNDIGFSNSSGNEYVYFDGTQSFVGIGTIDPDKKLHLTSGTEVTLRFESTDSTIQVDEEVGAIDFETRDSTLPGVIARIATPVSVVTGTTYGNLTFETGNASTLAERMRINSAGNVGIATTAPDKALEINHATGANLRLTYNDSDGTATNYADFSMAADGALEIQTAGTDEDIEIRTGTFDNAIFIDDSASMVGIGLVSPAAKLEINSLEADDAITLLLDQDDSDAAANVLEIQNAGTGPAIWVDSGEFYLDSDGRVQIDMVDTYGTLLDVAFTAAGVVQTNVVTGLNVDLSTLTDDNLSSIYGIHIDDFNNAGGGGATQYGLYVQGTNWDSGIYVEDNSYFGGNLGIGDADPAANLVVGSDAGAGFANGAGDAYIQADLEADGEVYFLGSYDTDLNGEAYRDLLIKDDGQLGYDSSSQRYKTNIENMEDVSWIYDLRPVNFEYKQKDENGNYLDYGNGVKKYGLIAEELEKINPAFVFYNILADGTKQVEGIHYREMVTPIIKAVQDLNKQVQSLANGVFQSITSTRINTEQIVTMLMSADKILSPLVETDNLMAKTIETEMIKPLADSDLMIQLDQVQNSKFKIQNKTGKELFTVDSDGNATVSGQLMAQSARLDSMQARQATISGELIADSAKFKKLSADTIEGLEARFAEFDESRRDKVATLAGDTINNYYYDSSTPAQNDSLTEDSNPETGLTEDQEASLSALADSILNTEYQLVNTDYLDISSLDTDSILVNEFLAVFGQATITNLEVTNNLVIQDSLMITNNSIASTMDRLYLQPSGMGGIDMMAGKFIIDESGNVSIGGNLMVSGVVNSQSVQANEVETKSMFAELLSPISSQSAGMKIALGGKQKLEINETASIDASGSASFTKLNIATAEATVSAGFGVLVPEITTNATAGQATLPAYDKELIIHNQNITKDSLIYITPTSDTGNKVIYVKNKADGVNGFFTVAIDKAIPQAIKFNWWIIN